MYKKPELPKKGEIVPFEKICMLISHYYLYDVLEYLAKHGPPEKPFSSDGCSLWVDKCHGHDIYPACFKHDLRYWCGVPGDEVGRLLADAEFAKDIAKITGCAELARTMFIGVGVGGTDKLPTSFRWGFGRE